MSPINREAFFTWYEQQKDKTFDFRLEFLDYCISDVDILRRCCAQFKSTLYARAISIHEEIKKSQSHSIYSH
jgi:hypothetical protein